MSAQDWTVIIAAVFVGISSLLTTIIGAVTLVIAFLERGRAADRAHEVAMRVEQVKVVLANTSAKQDAKLDQVAEKVEAVHVATNSLTDRLVETTKVEAHAAGVKEEKERSGTGEHRADTKKDK